MPSPPLPSLVRQHGQRPGRRTLVRGKGCAGDSPLVHAVPWLRVCLAAAPAHPCHVLPPLACAHARLPLKEPGVPPRSTSTDGGFTVASATFINNSASGNGEDQHGGQHAAGLACDLPSVMRCSRAPAPAPRWRHLLRRNGEDQRSGQARTWERPACMHACAHALRAQLRAASSSRRREQRRRWTLASLC